MSAPVNYVPPTEGTAPVRELVADAGTPDERRFVFYERLEIGRYREGAAPQPGFLFIHDPTVSSRHCVLAQTPEGRVFVRDVSRNGTRLDGHRLVPNIEAEMRSGQALTVGNGGTFVLAESTATVGTDALATTVGTMVTPDSAMVTVLVGDIRDYTRLVTQHPSAQLQQSVCRVFAALEAEVQACGGTVKEYQGDALFAFWEHGPLGKSAVAAGHAALRLHRRARELAADPSVWELRQWPLRLDWALATGVVLMSAIGLDRPTGLSMIGEPVIRAFRIEKFADDSTGPVVACAATKTMADDVFTFRDLGERVAKGFDRAEPIYALEGLRDVGMGSEDQTGPPPVRGRKERP